MSLDLRNIARLGLVLGVLASASCSNSGPQTVSDSTAFLAETAVASINAALSNDEKSASVSGSAGNAASLSSKAVRSLAASNTCGSSRYSPALGAASCAGTANNETVTSTYNCSVASGVDQLLKGSVTLTFSDSVTCSDWLTSTPTSGSVVWTSTNFMRTTSDASGVSTSSAPVKNYLGVSIGGGMKTAFSPAETSLNINGLHVTRLATGNVPVFDHTIVTPVALAVTGTLAAGTRTIVSGSVVVDHNTEGYTATGTISNLKWASANCCLPTSGTILFALSGNGKGSLAVDFDTGTCGKVSVSDATVVASASNPSPSPIPSGLASNYTATIGGCQ